MYKKYSVPFSLTGENWEIRFTRMDKYIHYKRICNENSLEKKILANLKFVKLQPIEPLNYPKEITDYLLLEFQSTISIAPQSSHTVFLTFPIEIGIFLPHGKLWQLLDVISLPKTKFTLYGDPANGIICKYWSSPIEESLPVVDSRQTGIVKLDIHNQSDEWQDVHKTILKADGMKIFFDQTLVCMQAKMKILSSVNAETIFINEPFQNEMEKSVEIFSQKKLSIATAKTVMLEGI